MSARRAWRDEGGAAAVEFALISSALFVLLFGVFELGLALHCGSKVRWALETSARDLLLDPTITQSQLTTKVMSRVSDIPASGSVVVTLVTDASNPSAKVLRASSSYTYPLSVPFLPTYNLRFGATVAVPQPAA